MRQSAGSREAPPANQLRAKSTQASQMELLCLQCRVKRATVVYCSLCRHTTRLCTACNIPHCASHLRHACATDDLTILTQLIRVAANNWNEVEKHVPTAHIAAGNGSARVLKTLAGIGGIAMDRPNELGWTAIHAASQQGQVECIRILAANGVSLDIVTSNRSATTPVIMACTSGQIASLHVLLDLGASPSATNRMKQSPANIACTYGYRKLLLLLIRRGADITSSDANGQTPIVMAITFGNYDCVGILLANRAVLPVCETELPFILREQKVSEVVLVLLLLLLLNRMK